MVRLLSYNKNPNIGVLARANDNMAFIPTEAPDMFSSTIEKALEVEVYRTNISGTILVGTMLAMNNNGVVLPKHVYGNEVEIIKKSKINYAILEDKLTALGNLILANSYGAIVAREFSRKSIKIIEDVFGCEVEKSPVRGFRNIGSVGIATDKGALLHPSIREEELKKIEEVLKVTVDIGTVNRGVGYVRTGIIVNTKDVVVGDLTTGVEVVRIEDTLVRG